MIPLEVVAHLNSPCIPAYGPILLDGVVAAGLGGELGSQEPGKWAGPDRVSKQIEAGHLPFARIEAGVDWWYAAGQASPQGPEQLRHLHKRIAQGHLERYTEAKSVNIATGVDKSLRLPQYLRPEWLTIRWVCIGDPERLQALLWRVGGVGKTTTHGNGWVRRWELSCGLAAEPFRWRGACDPWEIVAPSERAFAEDLTLRHLPVEAVQHFPSMRLQRRMMPLRPPYHTGHDPDASRNRLCWQVA